MKIDFSDVMKDKTEYMTKEEIELMLDYCLDHGKARDYMLILTLQRTARRITEILGEKPYTRKVGLRPIDIHPDGLIEFDILKKNHIKIRSTKTGAKRDLETIKELRRKKMPKRSMKPVDDFYLGELKHYIQSEGLRKYDRVFPITRVRAWQIIHNVARACKITRLKKGISTKNFRHSYAIQLLKDNPKNQAILIQVQQLLDHSSIEVTMHYAQFTQTDKKDSLNKSYNDDN